jgi:hypothetical protein
MTITLVIENTIYKKTKKYCGPRRNLVGSMPLASSSSSTTIRGRPCWSRSPISFISHDPPPASFSLIDHDLPSASIHQSCLAFLAHLTSSAPILHRPSWPQSAVCLVWPSWPQFAIGLFGHDLPLAMFGHDPLPATFSIISHISIAQLRRPQFLIDLQATIRHWPLCASLATIHHLPCRPRTIRH